MAQTLARGREAISDTDSVLPRGDISAILSQRDEVPIVCQCPAHVSFRARGELMSSDILAELIRISPILTDHWGGVLASALLSIFLGRAELKLSVNLCGIRSP